MCLEKKMEGNNSRGNTKITVFLDSLSHSQTDFSSSGSSDIPGILIIPHPAPSSLFQTPHSDADVIIGRISMPPHFTVNFQKGGQSHFP